MALNSVIGNEIQYYSTRKGIVNEIKRRAGSSATTEDYKAIDGKRNERRKSAFQSFIRQCV